MTTEPMKQVRHVTCRHCNKTYALEVHVSDWIAWCNGTVIQKAMPYLDADQRELLISETCGTCWNDMFPSDDE